MAQDLDQLKQTILARTPTGLNLEPGLGVREFIERLGGTSYQGRELSRALRVVDRMLESERCLIFLAMAGAMIPAGFRPLMVQLLEKRVIDGIVTTGANCIHDFVECLGYGHHPVDPSNVDDHSLGALKLNRIYDSVLSEDGFTRGTDVVVEYLRDNPAGGPITGRDLLARLGNFLNDGGYGRGMLSEAARLGLPVFCPALADSELGIDLMRARQLGQTVVIDQIGDIGESMEMVWAAHQAGGEIALITIGGGTPRNFFQQIGPTLEAFGREYVGHKYAVGITVDAPHWGGLSGSTFEEAISWRKYSDPEHATVRADATIAFPLLMQAALDRLASGFNRANLPSVRFNDGGSEVSFG
jgi:deoxyhypusine synthase